MTDEQKRKRFAGLIILCAACLGATTNQIVQVVIRAPDPDKEAFYMPQYFEDIVVYEVGTRRPFTISEVLDLIDQNPKVKWVGGPSVNKKPIYDVTLMAYPQYEDEFKIPQVRWNALRELCAKNLRETGGVAVSNVVAHWRSITNGIPPFGLAVADLK